MSSSLKLGTLFSFFLMFACQPQEVDTPTPERMDQRISDHAVVAWMSTSSTEPWWLEERLAPWPEFAQDRDPGRRQIVRATASTSREVIWAPADPDRLTAAVVDEKGVWSAVGVDGERRPFLVRGDLRGPLFRTVIDDPDLAADTAAWFGTTAPTALRISVLSEDSVRIASTAQDVVVSLMSEHNAVLAYRFRWDGAGWIRSARTLVSPATPQTPFLPIGATYDNFDAVVNPFSARLTSSAEGAAYVTWAATTTRLMRHNTLFGTSFAPLISDGDRTNRPTDLLIARIERNGSLAWTRLVGTPDVDDEVYAVAAGPAERVALVGRARRERGRDNTEWHPTVITLDAAGNTTAALVFDAADSGIAQSAAYAADGSLYIGGTEAWLQNPSGISLYQEGRPFLLRLEADHTSGAAVLSRSSEFLPATTGHAELRALAVDGGSLWLAGLERGPLTHSGDADRSVIRADGWRRSVALNTVAF